MITYYYDLGEGLIYYSEKDIDYRILSKCLRCIRVEFGNAQILKDHRNEWFDYPMDDKEISWIMLKAKRIPRSWDQYNT